MTSRPPLLCIHNLSVQIGAVPIVRNVSFHVEEGEMMAIIGPNGAGKTTLLKTLLGLRADYQGRIELDGKAIHQYPHKERARWMAYVPQHHDFADFNTVEEFIWMGRYPYISVFQQPTDMDRISVGNALDLTHTNHLIHRTLDTLSGGEQQKVMIAAALAQQPKLLLLDEPATFLDPKNQLEIHRLLCKINRETGTTIVSITHDINSALQSSHRIIALKAGQIAFCGTPLQLAHADILTQIYEIPFHLLPVETSACPLVIPTLASHQTETSSEGPVP
jgi:ABC-type cobalamin/Fe3+-siderophores transport system ATPase subunit